MRDGNVKVPTQLILLLRGQSSQLLLDPFLNYLLDIIFQRILSENL